MVLLNEGKCPISLPANHTVFNWSSMRAVSILFSMDQTLVIFDIIITIDSFRLFEFHEIRKWIYPVHPSGPAIYFV